MRRVPAEWLEFVPNDVVRSLGHYAARASALVGLDRRPEADPEDLVQEAVLRCLRSRAAWTKRPMELEELLRILRAIVRHCAVDLARKVRVRQRLEDAVLSRIGESPAVLTAPDPESFEGSPAASSGKPGGPIPASPSPP